MSGSGRAGLEAIVRTNEELTRDESALAATPSRWVVLARTWALASLAGENGWARLSSDPSIPARTDDYSNVLGVLCVATP